MFNTLILFVISTWTAEADKYTAMNDRYTGLGNALGRIDGASKSGDVIGVASGVLLMASFVPGPIGLVAAVAGTILGFFGGGRNEEEERLKKALEELDREVNLLEKEVDALADIVERAFEAVKYEIRSLILNEALVGIKVLQKQYNATKTYKTKAHVIGFLNTCKHYRVIYGHQSMALFLLSQESGTLKEHILLERGLSDYLHFASTVTISYTHSIILFASCAAIMAKRNGQNMTATREELIQTANATYVEFTRQILFDSLKRFLLKRERETKQGVESKNDTSDLPPGYHWFISNCLLEQLRPGSLQYDPPFVSHTDDAQTALSHSYLFFKHGQNFQGFPTQIHISYFGAILQALTEERKAKAQHASKCLHRLSKINCRGTFIPKEVTKCLLSGNITYYIARCTRQCNPPQASQSFVVNKTHGEYKIQVFLYDNDIPGLSIKSTETEYASEVYETDFSLFM